MDELLKAAQGLDELLLGGRVDPLGEVSKRVFEAVRVMRKFARHHKERVVALKAERDGAENQLIETARVLDNMTRWRSLETEKELLERRGRELVTDR